MLKGAFNEKPSVAKYSTFWNIGVALRYLKVLGANDTLSLRLLIIKTVMLLALIRPTRSVNLSKLDICAHGFTVTGVTFKAQNSSKQRRASKPLVDFFYPRYPEDQAIWPITTLQAYEDGTKEFTENKKYLLFLSWIGKHNPVSSSTTARWLKICLQKQVLIPKLILLGKHQAPQLQLLE